MGRRRTRLDDRPDACFERVSSGGSEVDWRILVGSSRGQALVPDPPGMAVSTLRIARFVGRNRCGFLPRPTMARRRIGNFGSMP